MKSLFTILSLALTLSAFAQDTVTIDDLGTIDLNLDTPATQAHTVNYPNYRIGGGNAANRKITDCLLLDIRHSDVVLSVAQKLKLGKEIRVLEGFSSDDENGEGQEIKPIVKGNHVVYSLDIGSLYMTFLQAKTRSGEALNKVITKTLPAVRQGNTVAAPVGLLYVRDCRF